MPGPAQPAAAGGLSDRAAELVGDFVTATALSTHERLGTVAGVGVSTQIGDRPMTIGTSTPLAEEVDRVQFAIGTGPCLHALGSGELLYVPDLGRDDRWGDYGPQAATLGAVCCISVPVRTAARTAAVVKVYAGEVDGLDARQRETARAVGTELAGAFALADQLTDHAASLDDMTALMTNRRAIDLAIGISMERAQVDADTAFGLLRSRSQHDNVKLWRVAADVVGSIPGSDPSDLVPHYNPHR